jgi:hypothetical protein
MRQQHFPTVVILLTTVITAYLLWLGDNSTTESMTISLPHPLAKQETLVVGNETIDSGLNSISALGASIANATSGAEIKREGDR